MARQHGHRARWLAAAALALATLAWLAQPVAPLRLAAGSEGAHELVLQGPGQNRISLRVTWHLAPAWQALLAGWLETDKGEGKMSAESMGKENMGRGNRT